MKTKMTCAVNAIKSTVKGDIGVAKTMASGAYSAFQSGGIKAAGADLYHRGARAWQNSSKADKMRYAGYGAAGAAGAGATAWGLSGD